MKNYKITAIQQGATVYNENGNGMYLNTTNREDKKHIMDFFGVPGVTMRTVERVTPAARRETFTVGDYLAGRQIISSFYFNNKVMMVRCNGTTPITLEAAVKFVAAAAPRPAFVEAGVEVAASGKDVAWLIAIEKKILAERPIRVAGLLKKNIPATMEEFLVKFFKEYNVDIDTIFVDTREVQTDNGRRRSMGDLFLLSKYYYPKTRLIDVVKALQITLPKMITTGYENSYCSTIHKQVWYYDNGGRNNHVYSDTTPDEYKVLRAKYLSLFK